MHLCLKFGAVLLLAAVAIPSRGQKSTPVPEQAPTGSTCTSTAAAPCAPAAQKPSAAERFPYPGTPAQVPEAPSRASPSAPTDAARQHPYPGTAAPQESSSSNTAGGSSGGSSSSSSGDPATADANAGPDTPDPAAPPRRRKLAKINAQSDDERAGEDLDVAHYYFGRGNYQAAYLRAKDAVKAQPDDPEGHLAVAEAAEKLKKRDEAIVEYKSYLLLDPDGQKVKIARKALATLKESP